MMVISGRDFLSFEKYLKTSLDSKSSPVGELSEDDDEDDNNNTNKRRKIIILIGFFHVFICLLLLLLFRRDIIIFYGVWLFGLHGQNVSHCASTSWMIVVVIDFSLLLSSNGNVRNYFHCLRVFILR